MSAARVLFYLAILNLAFLATEVVVNISGTFLFWGQ
jgi:hypothetical protein